VNTSPVTNEAGLFRTVSQGVYHIAFPDVGVEFNVDRLRRERHDLHGELSVSCGIVGARVIDGVLSVGSFNLSNPQAAQQRARLLAERASGIDWASMIEVVRQRVLTAERTGEPSILLRTVPKLSERQTDHEVLGLAFPKRHPSIVFGDGGTAKSYLALRLASDLAAAGERVLYCDWELDAAAHRQRLEMISGSEMPDVKYLRLDRPLIHDLDRLHRVVKQDGSTYAILDSVGYGTAGAPESAEAAMDFCRGARQLGIGSLWLAHVTKADQGDQRPFGSTFWHNSARATWNLKLASTSPDGRSLQLAAFNRKCNLGRLRPPVGIRVEFDLDRVSFTTIDATTIDEVASSLPLWQRIKGIVAGGPQTLAIINHELQHGNVESIDRIVRKHNTLFTKVSGSDGVTRVALRERRAS
jgi:hypothetical protein